MAKGPKAKKGGKGSVAKPKKLRGAARLIDPAVAENFRQDVDQWMRLNQKVEKAQKDIRAFQTGALKKDGFTVKMVKDAILGMTPQGADKLRLEIANRLLPAAMLGQKIAGKKVDDQLGFFLDRGPVDTKQQAYDEGVAAFLANQPLKPPYDPDTDEYKRFTAGFHDTQDKAVRGGISKLDKAKAKTAAAEGAKADKGGGGKPPRGGRATSPSGIKAAADRAAARSVGAGKDQDAGPPRAGLGAVAMTRDAAEGSEAFPDEGTVTH